MAAIRLMIARDLSLVWAGGRIANFKVYINVMIRSSAVASVCASWRGSVAGTDGTPI